MDDHPLLREGIAAVIQDERDIVLIDQACNGMEAIDKFRSHRPDVTLMDLQMPGMNGIDTIIAIRREFSQPALSCSPRMREMSRHCVLSRRGPPDTF